MSCSPGASYAMLDGNGRTRWTARRKTTQRGSRPGDRRPAELLARRDPTSLRPTGSPDPVKRTVLPAPHPRDHVETGIAWELWALARSGRAVVLGRLDPLEGGDDVGQHIHSSRYPDDRIARCNRVKIERPAQNITQGRRRPGPHGGVTPRWSRPGRPAFCDWLQGNSREPARRSRVGPAGVGVLRGQGAPDLDRFPRGAACRLGLSQPAQPDSTPSSARARSDGSG